MYTDSAMKVDRPCKKAIFVIISDNQELKDGYSTPLTPSSQCYYKMTTQLFKSVVSWDATVSLKNNW